MVRMSLAECYTLNDLTVQAFELCVTLMDR